MKLRFLVLTLLIALITSIHSAMAAPAFTVIGSVKKTDGTLVEDSLTIIVTNTTRDITIETTLGEVKLGEYGVTFFNWIGSVAEVDDRITVIAQDSEGNAISQVDYQLTANDLDDFLATIDLSIESVTIESVSVSSSNAKAGDILTFILIGSPEHSASVSVEDAVSITDLPLAEGDAGIYTSSYTVKDGDDVSESTLIFRLSSVTDTTKKITIDTIPPPAPIELQVVGGKIDPENVSVVVITATASSLSEVTVTLTDAAGASISESVDAIDSGQIEVSLDATELTDGEITVTAQEAPDLAGNVGEIAEIIVEKSIPQPDFSISTSPNSRTVQIGGSVDFTVLISGENDFNETVNLSVDESTLPAACEAIFDPASVQPSKIEAMKTSMLTISTSGSTPAGSYTIKVLAHTDSDSKMIEIALTIHKSTALITLNLSPENSIPFQGTLNVFGQMSFIDEPADQRVNLPITLTMTVPNENSIEKTLITDDDRAFHEEISLDQVGTWTIVATWNGDEKYDIVSTEKTIEVVKAKSTISWMTLPEDVNPEAAIVDETVTIALQLDPSIEASSIALTISKPGPTSDEQIIAVTDSSGAVLTEITLELEGVWEITAEWEGNANYDGCTSQTHQIDVTEITALTGDVNGDNKVDIFDLVLVGSQFAQVGEGLEGDVNGDGQVNIFDLVLVGSHFGETATAGAPFQQTNSLFYHLISDQELRDLIYALEGSPSVSFGEGAEIALQMLRKIRHKNSKPIQTRLLQNYPNPFNPETWIPYDLAVSANVTMEIYDLTGRLVRRLEIGYQKAGNYRSQKDAVFWDGCDAFGEQVASGVYFIKMKAGSFLQTRRLVVLK